MHCRRLLQTLQTDEQQKPGAQLAHSGGWRLEPGWRVAAWCLELLPRNLGPALRRETSTSTSRGPPPPAPASTTKQNIIFSLNIAHGEDTMPRNSHGYRNCTPACTEVAKILRKEKTFWTLVMNGSESKSRMWLVFGSTTSGKSDIKLCTLHSCRCEWASSLLCWCWCTSASCLLYCTPASCSTPAGALLSPADTIFCHVRSQTAGQGHQTPHHGHSHSTASQSSATLTSILSETCYY